jgi:peroxiredoxin
MASGEGAQPKVGDFSAKDLQGKTVRLSELLKKGPVLLDFWTTYCKPCKLELPELDRMHRAYRDMGFTVVAISQDDPKTMRAVKPYVEQRKFEMLVLLDPEKQVGNKLNVRLHPTSFLVGQDGSVVHFAQGYSPGDEKALEGKVREMLGLGAGEGDSEATQ